MYVLHLGEEGATDTNDEWSRHHQQLRKGRGRGGEGEEGRGRRGGGGGEGGREGEEGGGRWSAASEEQLIHCDVGQLPKPPRGNGLGGLKLWQLCSSKTTRRATRM